MRKIFPVLLLLLLTGCRGESGPLTERFGNPQSGWPVDSQIEYDRGYQEGEYFIEVYEPNWFVWSRPHGNWSDVEVEAEARQVVGSPAGHFGLLCRYRPPDRFYYFGITDDGQYAILRVENGESELLTGTGFQPSPAVRPVNGVYRIRAVCRGDLLTLYVNNEQVAQASDDLLQRGDAGIGVGSDTDSSVRVHFDNLTISPVEESGE